jgi:hypothetical protein
METFRGRTLVDHRLGVIDLLEYGDGGGLVFYQVTAYEDVKVGGGGIALKVAAEHFLSVLTVNDAMLYVVLFIAIGYHTEGALYLGGGFYGGFQITDMGFVHGPVLFPNRETDVFSCGAFQEFAAVGICE